MGVTILTPKYEYFNVYLNINPFYVIGLTMKTRTKLFARAKENKK